MTITGEVCAYNMFQRSRISEYLWSSNGVKRITLHRRRNIHGYGMCLDVDRLKAVDVRELRWQTMIEEEQMTYFTVVTSRRRSGSGRRTIT